MNSWKVILATIVIFGAGVLTGGLVLELTQELNAERHPRAGTRSFQPGSPGGMRLEFLRRIQSALEVTPEQREQIDKVLKQSQDRTRKIMEPVSPQLRQELLRAKSEFREILTPAQQTRFDDLLKQQQLLKERRSGQHPESSITNTIGTNSI